MSSKLGLDMLPPEHYEAIGRLIIACTRLDAVMTDLICRCGHIDFTTGLMVVHHQQFASKHDTLKAILDARDPRLSPLPPDFVDLLNRAKELYDYRSTLVHAAWVVGLMGSPSTERITARGKLTRSRQHQPTEKILECAREANAIVDRLEALQESLY